MIFQMLGLIEANKTKRLRMQPPFTKYKIHLKSVCNFFKNIYNHSVQYNYKRF